MFRLLKRWADKAAQDRIAALEADLERAKVTIRVQAVELDGLAGVVARDRKRVEAETSIAARRIAHNIEKPEQRE
jgi:hypothetical protein